MKAKKTLLSIALISLFTAYTFAQGVGINNTGAQPHSSAILDVSSTTQGVLISRMSEAQRDAISGPATGLQIYNTDTDCINMWDGGTWRQSCFDCSFTSPILGSNSPICEGQTLNLTATTISGATYSWSGPNGFTSTSQNPSIANATAAASGTYAVQVTLSGCTSSPVYLTVTVNTTPQTPTAGNNGPVCEGGNVNLTASNIVGATYSWTGPNGFNSTSQNPSITNVATSHAGTYSVTAVANGCTSAAGTTTLVVNTIPSAPTAGSNSPICENTTLNLTASTVSGATYSWTGPNGFSSTTQNPSISNAPSAAAGTYSVVATVNGCSSTAGTTSVTINGGGGGGPQTFSYTGSMQTFIVPSCITSVTIEAWGAQGSIGANGTSLAGDGGLGGYAKGDLSVSPGQSLYVFVGGTGGQNAGGYNGGGTGGNGANGNYPKGGGGGGASDVRSGGTGTGNRVIVAAGGGGGGGEEGSYYGGDGGSGGGSTGGTGGQAQGNPGYGQGGQGGTQSAGGAFGCYTGGGHCGTAGSLGQGGNGANTNSGGGGGGGGGYYGGGGGGDWAGAGGGGGGSSYLGGVTNSSTISGFWTGNGKVVISW